MMKEFLQLVGYRILDAENGKIGEELFDQHAVDLVITDIIMPVQEGMQTIMAIRKKSDVPIIAISAGSKNLMALDYLHVSKDMGANSFFVKPFDLDVCLQEINHLLEDS